MDTRPGAVRLRCNYLENPLAVDEPEILLGWEAQVAVRGALVEAYQIQAAATAEALAQGKADLWDSGEQPMPNMPRILYAGKELKAFETCWWRVRLRGKGQSGDWSAPAFFARGFLAQSDWRGEWIAYPFEGAHTAKYFRKDFSVGKPLKRAVLYATARGIYQAEINGQSVGHDVFAPGWTDYHKRIYYNAYEVTGLLNAGGNAIGLALGDGWFKGDVGFSEKCNIYGFRTDVLANLRLEYADGRVETVATGEDWTTSTGPVLQSGFLPGENYDARMELAGWSRPGGGAGWLKPKTFPLEGREAWDNSALRMVKHNPLLQAYPCEPVRRTQELTVRESWQTLPGSQVCDFGQNFAGRVRLRLQGRAGQMLRLRFGEMVNPDRTLYVENLRTAACTDTYVCKGGEEIWEPEFTFHGFRYAEITGLEPGQQAELTGVVLGSDTRRVGTFSCSDAMVNQLYSNLLWTQRANFLEVPTDCPQRDERLGWTGDAQVFIRTATFNMDVAAFFHKWLRDLEDTQREDGSVCNVAPKSFIDDKADAAWGDAVVICPWWIYQVYGDTQVLRKHYGMMQRYVGYLKETSRNNLRGTWTHCFGDWLSINADTPKEVIQTAMYAYVVDLLRQSAQALGKEDDARAYAQMRQDIQAAFVKEFVDAQGKVRGDTQTAYVLTLHHNLLSAELREKAAAHLVENLQRHGVHLNTGFVGTPYLLHVLSDIGRDDLAYQLLFNDTYPSWGYSIRNGATTIWERWNGWKTEDGCGDANMNSFSHYAYGSVGEWMFRKVAGLELLEPGYRRFRLHPRPTERLSWVKTGFHSVYGPVVSEWERGGNGFTLKAGVPTGTTAEIILPAGATLTVDGKPVEGCGAVRLIEKSVERTVLEVGSGEYLFCTK